MNDRRMQFAVGVVALGSIFIAAILMLINSSSSSGIFAWGRGKYQLKILLPGAPGVGPDTPVRKNGVLIGRVGSVEDLDDGVIVLVNVDKGRTLTTQHKPHVRTSVLGDATIDFSTDGSVGDRTPLTDQQEVKGVIDSNPLDAIAKLGDLQDDIQQTMNALARAGNEVADLAKRVDEAFGSDTQAGRVRRFMDTTERAMDQFGQTMASLNQILGDDPIPQQVPPIPSGQNPNLQRSANYQPQPAGQQPQLGQPSLLGGQQPPIAGQQPPVGGQPPLLTGQQPIVTGEQMRNRIRQGLNELPDAIHETNQAMRDFRTVLESANKNFKNLEGFTEPLGKNGPQIATSMVDAVKGLDKLVEEFTLLSTALNSKDGTIGQLIHDDTLYKRLNTLTLNANQVLVQIHDLAQRVKVVVEDARIFMDKIAREPGRVISGAFSEPSMVK